MADVMAVADRVVVLRLGRNNGVYNVADVTSETLIAAITGAVDHSAAPRRIPERTDAAPAATRDDEPAGQTSGGTVIRMPRGGSRRTPRPRGDGSR
jgi:D-xylose transport system ATP-binding protein